MRTKVNIPMTTGGNWRMPIWMYLVTSSAKQTVRTQRITQIMPMIKPRRVIY